MRVKGLDNGYLYTKDNDMRIFRSAYVKSGVAMGSSAFISIDGVDYTVGAGEKSVSFDKTDSEINKVCTLANLAMTGSDEYNLVVGLPISQYKSQRDKFKKMILSYNGSYVVYKGEEMRIKINDVLVFPQGIGALLSLNELKGDNIIFDIGGLTIDIAYIEMVCGNPVLHKFDTWTEGIQKMYAKIINQVNDKYNLTLPVNYAEKILIDDLLIDGVIQPKDFLLPILSQYLEPIFLEFQLNYPSKNTKIHLCGGSATVIKDLFMKRFPNASLMNNSQFANAIGYYKVGCQKFGMPDTTKQIQVSTCRR